MSETNKSALSIISFNIVRFLFAEDQTPHPRFPTDVDYVSVGPAIALQVQEINIHHCCHFHNLLALDNAIPYPSLGTRHSCTMITDITSMIIIVACFYHHHPSVPVTNFDIDTNTTIITVSFVALY